MKITLTAKIKILPNEEEKALLLETMRTYAKACDFVSRYVLDTHDLSQSGLHKALYYDIRERFGLGAQMTQSVLKTVVASYRTIRTNEGRWIRPSFKHPQCDLVWNRDYSLKEGVVSLNTLDGRRKMPFEKKGMERYFDGSWKFGTAKLVTKHGKWFLHMSMTTEVEEVSDFEMRNVVGVDLGINFLATSYDSNGKTAFVSGREIKNKRAHYKELRRELQKNRTPSSRRRLKRIGHRENRWMQDVNHRASKALVDSHPSRTLFVLENLAGIRGATEKVCRDDRYISASWAFYDFRQKLEYKAQIAGSKVIAVDPRHTSQTCPKCGHTESSNRNKKKHLFRCKSCGYESNDDRIGAMNLHRKGIEYLEAVTAQQAAG